MTRLPHSCVIAASQHRNSVTVLERGSLISLLISVTWKRVKHIAASVLAHHTSV